MQLFCANEKESRTDRRDRREAVFLFPAGDYELVRCICPLLTQSGHSPTGTQPARVVNGHEGSKCKRCDNTSTGLTRSVPSWDRFNKENHLLLLVFRGEGRGMRALLLGTLLVIGLISRATAQLAVGPVPIMSTINGIPITVSVTSWITVNSVGDNYRGRENLRRPNRSAEKVFRCLGQLQA
jgi:hypothetical protein